MFRTTIACFFSLVYLVNCSSSTNNEIYGDKSSLKSPEQIYIQAMQFFDSKQFDMAEEEFKKIVKLYPLSNEAIQGEIMLGFINYLKMDYDKAILKFNKIIQKYPSHKNLDYVYYMIAICTYEQITNHELDGYYNEVSLENFNQVILRFPESEYAKDSRQKIILVKSNKAAKHMEIGRFYLKEKKYTAALNRFKIVVEDYSMTKFTPEALHRMVEAYFEMGMIEESNKTAAVLGYNYPESKWYRFSYNLLKNINEDSFFDKVSNIFN